jgi:hypothetical protein
MPHYQNQIPSYLKESNKKYEYLIGGILLIIASIYLANLALNHEEIRELPIIDGVILAVSAILFISGIGLIAIDIRYYFKNLSYYS